MTPMIDSKTFGPVDGSIVRLTIDKGYGFIEIPELGRDIFFHRSALEDSLVFEDLDIGEAVRLEYTNTIKGLRAVSVSARR